LFMDVFYEWDFFYFKTQLYILFTISSYLFVYIVYKRVKL